VPIVLPTESDLEVDHLISASAEDDARRLGTTDDFDYCTAQTLEGDEISDGMDMAIPP